MRKILAIMAVAASVLSMSGCAAAWQKVTYTDDLYSVHNKIAIANRQKAEAELAKAQYEAEQAQYEATLARIKAEAAKQGVTVSEGDINVYDAVLADSYESAYARRLYGFSSPTYRMPSSYYSLQYSDAFHYASAYDPAFYNVMVSGDMVWVEPKYITSMFGSWGAAVVPSYGWYYGWGAPYRYGYYGYYGYNPYDYYWNMGWCYGWSNPYYWGWGYPYYPYHHHHHYPHRPPHHHNPPHAGSGSVGSTGVHHNRPGMVVGRNPGASRPADRGGSVGSTSSSRPSSGRTTQPTYRSGGSSSSSSRYNSGSSSYRSSGSSTYRSSGSSSSSSSSSSYRSTPSYSGGGSRSSYSGGSSGGGYSGGGNSRGR